MNKELALHIILLSPPAGHDFALQKGTANHVPVQIQRSTGGDLLFSLSIPVKTKADKPGEPLFSGPFVQGHSGGKFIYIDIGAAAGQVGGITRRLKIPLYGIPNEVVFHALTNPDMTLETYIIGTHKDGGPNCATPKPFDGWKLVSSNPASR